MNGIILSWQALTTLLIIIIMLIALIREVARPDLILLGTLGLLLLPGIITPEEAFAGFSNPAMLTVGALFVVAAGIQNTGALAFADKFLFVRKARLPFVLLRLMLTTASMSAFLNNTPIVAMLIPRLQTWSERSGIPASKLMIPLSYAAIIGGMTTLIGTSTNLLVSGLMQAAGHEGLGMFDLTWVGLPAAVCAIIYFVLVGHRLLPDRSQPSALKDDLKNYFFEVRITADSPLIGRSIEAAELRALGDAYLVHIRHEDAIIPATPETVLRVDDVLTFRGKLSVLDQLLERNGFERVMPELENRGRETLPLFEAVIAPTSSLVGKTLKEAGFRDAYHGVVLGIQRRDAMIEGPLGRIPLKAGDLLLIEARAGFDRRWNELRDEFYLVAPRRPVRAKPQKGKAPLALLILLTVIILAATGIASIVVTAFLGGLAMIATRCLPGQEARKAVELPVLVVIACALGLGQAIETSGLADALAKIVINLAAALGPLGVIAAVYIATSLLTELITNNAAAALMMAIAMSAARDLGAEPKAFAIAVAIAASASFMTPIGYQTNLMVMSAGGYRFSDYLRSGLIVNVLVGTVAIGMIGWIWL